MAGFWSMIGLVFRSLLTGAETVNQSGEAAGESPVARDVLCRYGIARFVPAKSSIRTGAMPADAIADMAVDALLSVHDTDAVRIDQYFIPDPDAADPFQAVREAQLGALNVGHRQDADTVFWGRQDPGTGYLDLYMISDALTSPLYDLLMYQVYHFRQTTHPDVAEALRLLLTSQLVLQSHGGEQRALQIARLGVILEDLQERVLRGDTFSQAGEGAAMAYGFAAFILSETGDRTYCASALRVMEPHIRKMVRDIAEKPAQIKDQDKVQAANAAMHHDVKEQTVDLLKRITDFSKVSPQITAALALYGSLVNWSLVANLNVRAASLSIAVWRILEQRIELSMGTPVSRGLSICKLAEAFVLTGKEKENAKFVEKGAAYYRRGLGVLNARLHGSLYAITAYGLAEAIVTSATIRDVTIPDAQVVPVFQAALKVCNRRDQPYIWGRIMFALATVYLTSGSLHKDREMLTHARMSFSHAYEAFTESCARGAARAASGGYTRSENLLSQLGHRKAIEDATRVS